MKEDLLTRLERENLTIASFNKRILAYFIDNLVLSLIVFVIFYDKLLNAKDLFDTAQIFGRFLLRIFIASYYLPNNFYLFIWGKFRKNGMQNHYFR